MFLAKRIVIRKGDTEKGETLVLAQSNLNREKSVVEVHLDGGHHLVEGLHTTLAAGHHQQGGAIAHLAAIDAHLR